MGQDKKSFWSKKNGPNEIGTMFLGSNRFKPKKILGPKSLIKIGSVTANILLIWTNVTSTNVVWTNATLTVDIS